MPRKKIEYSDVYPFHIYGRSNNSEWFPIDQKRCWEIFCYFLNYVSRAYDFNVHSFVLMNNHYHLIASTPRNNLSFIMNRLTTEISQAINDIAGTKNHIFGGKYRATVIKKGSYYLYATKYIYRNPIEAFICDKVEHYPYSTISGLIGKNPLLMPISECKIFYEYLTNDYIELITLCNEKYSDDQRDVIKKAIRKNEFKMNKRAEKDFF